MVLFNDAEDWIRVLSSILDRGYDCMTFFYNLSSHEFAGSDAILLGAETLCGLHPVETVSTVSRICAEVICVCMR